MRDDVFFGHLETLCQEEEAQAETDPLQPRVLQLSHEERGEHCKAFNLTRPADPIFQVLLVLNSRSPWSMLFGTLCYFGDFRDATLVCPFPNLDGKDQTIRKMTSEKQTTESSTSFCQRCRTKRSWWAVAKSSCLFWSIVARRTSWLRTTPTFQHGMGCPPVMLRMKSAVKTRRCCSLNQVFQRSK